MRRFLVFFATACMATGFIRLVSAQEASTEQGEVSKPKLIEVDTNKDGKPDRWEYFKDGVQDRIESDKNFDGKPDMTVYFEGGKLSRVEIDTDYDGKVDRWDRF